MADDANPFSDIFSGSPTQSAQPGSPTEEANPFADIMKPEADTNVGGAFMHSLERGFAPAVASLPAMGAGAEIGATIGSPGGPIGVGIGGIVGGLAGAFAGSEAVSAAQSWALSQLPESWQDMLGQSAKQQQAEAEKQPVASFLGGLVPYALTMRPSFNMATAALPENATAIQRLMANPLTAHIFGGAVTGGMELGTEAANHESPDWTKISIATAFGTIFNKPTRIGESLTEVGAGPARFALGRPEPVAPAVAPEQPAKPPEAAPAQPAVKPPGISEKEWNETLLGQKPEPQPTVAQAGDAKVLGPGIDEAVFMGAHEQAPEALMTAQDTARTEASVLRPEESAPSVGTVARRMEPDLFTQYDALQAQRDDLASHPDAPAVQQHIDATNAQINALGPQVAAAYRRAADVVQSPTVEPPAPEPVQPTQPAPEGQTPTAGAPTAPSRETLDAEQASIAQQVTANLIAAGRSPDEAAAGGQLLGHYYRTRSQKFKGALGSPMELFNQQGPTIRRYGASVAPLMPTEARPTIAPEKAPEIIPQNIPGEIAQQAQPVAAPEIPSTGSRVNGYTTAKGSTYEVHEDGTTTRNKSYHPEHGKEDQGAKERSARTIYTDEPASELSSAGLTGVNRKGKVGPPSTRVIINDREGKAVRWTWNWITKKWVQASGGIPFHNDPAVGRYPLEVWQPAEDVPETVGRGFRGMHAGNQITEVRHSEPAATAKGTPASEIEALDPSNITVDASRFQFKAGGDEQGVSERLQGVEKWDPRLAGTALVFRDAEGKNWIADGHQRLGLAKRLMEGGHPPIKINAFVLDAKDGITDADARAIAAAKNIAEGTGSSVDAAKVIRDAMEKGIDLPPLPPRSALTRDGYALAELGQEAFGLIVNEVVPTQQGAIVGRLVKNPDQQVEALRLLAAIKPENVTQAEMVVRDMLSSGTEMTTQGTLFGDEAFASSIVRERAKIADESLKLLRRDKQTFRTLVDEAERIQGAGANVLDQTANQGRLSTDEQAADFLKQLAFRAGPVSDALSAVARQLKAGEIKPGDAARSFLESVRRAVESGVVEGTDAGGAELGAGGQRPVDEGPTFFQHAPPIDTPEFNRWFGDSKVVDESGAPLVVYHGTNNREFDAFSKKARGGMGGALGFWFSSTPEGAAPFARPRFAGVEPRVLETYLSVKNPREFDGHAAFTDAVNAEKGKTVEDRVKAFGRRIARDGNDGIVIRGSDTDGGGKRDDWVALDPTQIKSTANRGTFNPNDARILYQSRKPEPWRPGEMFGGFDTERGLEGLPQTLIPGVKPLTDAERIAAEAAKPLKGGAAPPKPGSLFDEQGREDSAAQRELFQPAYHGTPHIFDKFDSSKIGTGEGAQAFGHGLYFAGRKEVAVYYRETLTNDVVGPAQRVLKKAGDDIAAAIAATQTEIDRLNGLDLKPETGAVTRDKKVAARQSELAELTAFKETGKWRTSGRLYHVEVPEEHELLDWDKPLSEQPSQIRRALEEIPTIKKYIEDRHDVDGFDPSGSELYKVLSDRVGGDAAASAALREAGIPGHRFLDQQSRPNQQIADIKLLLRDVEDAVARFPKDKGFVAEAQRLRNKLAEFEAQQTHNYVVYDDSRVNILNYEQQKRGAIQFAPGRKPLIKLFADADSSTFFHEAGHQWLEDMMRDAVHPSAPGSLKDDALTVREALGMKPDQTSPTTRQHERWARWTEQYLREGVAPSPGLARVFAQLRTWLTQIYQSIKGLGTPINEDIRGVFDRLLAEEPNRTVISPEDLAREPSLPSIHEAEAAEAAPHEAHGIGDRIVAERDDYLSRQPPEVQNEIEAILQKHQEEAARAAGTEPATEAGASAGGPAAVVGGGIESGAEPAGGESGGERSPQLGGGSNGVSESAGPTTPGEPTDNAGLRQQRPGAAGATGAHALAPTPSTLFGPAESPFVDKAGNIRIENLTSDQDVAQAIRDAAQENNDFIGDRRGVITDGQVLDLADALGMTAESLNRRKLGEAFSAEQVVAARKLLIQSATDVRDVMAKAAAPTSTDEDVLAYAHAKARHQMIQAQVAGITAEAGRALRAFRSLVGDAEAQGVDQFLRSATGKTLFQLKEEAKLGSQLDTPMKVSKFVRDAQKRGFGSMILEYWINGLISGPATHTTYMVGNVILSLHKAGPETLAAALIGSAARAAGRKGEVVNFGEAAAKLRGAHLGIPAATQAAFDALRTGVTTRLPGETPRVLPFQPGSELARSVGINESARYSDAMPALYGAVQGIQDGIVSLGTLLKAGGVQGAPMVGLRYSPLGAIPDIAVRGVDVLPLGTVARIPSRAIAAIHSFFRTVNYSMEKNALAYRSAIASGKTGTAFDAHVANMRQNPTTDMMESAVKQATDATLMGRGSEFVQALGKLTNVKILGFPFLKFVDPFVHISGNIIDQSIVQRTPLGLLAPEIRADLMGKNGTVAQDTAAARMLVGTALSIGFGSLAAQGLMSGSGPSDPRQAAVWRLAGNQAHSVRIGDVWYDVHRLGPMGMLASVAADMYDVAHGASEGDMGKMGAALLQAFTHTMLDEGFGRGPADLIQALTDPQRYGPSYVRNQIASFVPFSVGMGQVARAMDPYARQARSIMDQIKSKVPGLSETLLPRRDIWGQPLPSTEVFGTPGLSAIYTTQVNNDPVNQALLNLSIYPAQVDHAIRGVPLTDEQFDQYATIAGGMAKQRLDLIVRSPQWSTWPASTQHDIVESTISQSREVARNVVMGHWPQIASDAVRGRLQQLQPSTSGE